MTYPTVLQMIDGMSRRAGLERRILPHMLRHRYGRALSESGEGVRGHPGTIGPCFAGVDQGVHPSVGGLAASGGGWPRPPAREP